jgi:hypothetical protein
MLDDGDSEERLGLLLAEGGWGWGFRVADLDAARTQRHAAAAAEAVELARRLERPTLISAALDVAGAANSETGGYGAAHELQLQRLALVPELDDPAEIADIYGTLLWGMVHIGKYREAVDMPTTVFTPSGAVMGKGGSVRMLEVFRAVAFYRLGEWGRFWELFDKIDAQEQAARPIPTYHVQRLYGVAAYLREISGDSARADEMIEWVDRSQRSRDSVGISGPRLWVVQTLVRRGLIAEARERLAVDDPVREAQNRDLTFEAWAEVIAADGTWDEAAAIVSRARAWAAQTQLVALPAIADRLEGQAAIAAGDLERGLGLLRGAIATQRQLDAAWDRARTELILAEALAAHGRPGEAAEVAGSALETLSSLLAPLETSRAGELARR